MNVVHAPDPTHPSWPACGAYGYGYTISADPAKVTCRRCTERPGARRTQRFHPAFTPAQAERIEIVAAAAGVTPAEWLRQVALGVVGS